MIKIKHLSIAALTIGLSVFVGCKKNFDSPPVKTVNAGTGISASQLKAMQAASPSGVKRFYGDTSIYATVTADETSGNIYKTVYLRDANGTAISMHLTSAGGLYVGDYIRVNLNYSYGSVIDASNGSIQIDSVTTLNQVIKISVGNPVAPITVPSLSVITANPAQYDAQLVQINNTQFTNAYIGKPYATQGQNTPATSITYLGECNPYVFPAEVYTSGFANFVNPTILIPPNNGTFTGVVQLYGTAIELIIRNYHELQFNGSLCGTTPLDTVHMTFSGATDKATGVPIGWTNWTEPGTSTPWQAVASAAGPGTVTNPCFTAAGPFANGANTASARTWLVTPLISYSSTQKLSFRDQSKYNTNNYIQLFVYYSTNYDGTNVGSATWHPITVPITTSGTWNSQTVSLSNYLGTGTGAYNGSYAVAFKFTSNTTDSTAAYFLDDVVIH